VAERIVRSIEDRLGGSVRYVRGGSGADSNLAQLVLVRLVQDRCLVSVDSSGALLHRRGYRLATAKAPLRETLAAAMVLASGWDTASPLIDPFCGSGTVAIEAALLARHIPPGRARRFAFMNWPDFDSGLWQSLLVEGEPGHGTYRPLILASDRDRGAVEAAKANAVRAGVSDCIQFSCRPISAIQPPSGPGWIVTNPPYGLRASRDKDLRNLYEQFGKVLRAKCPGWSLVMLCNSGPLQRRVGFDFDEGISLMTGGLRVKLVRARVPAVQKYSPDSP
jgi:putative N6-adenine-specific DNA methylase